MSLLKSFPEFPEVQIISRGILCCRLQEKWAEIRKFAEENKLEELATFVKNLKDSDSFGGGVLRRNTFQVSHKIALVGLGFFGPHGTETASYDVTLHMELTYKQRTLRQFHWYKVPAQKGLPFWVTLHEPYVIQPNTFYNIAFHLEGPKTGICDPNHIQQQIVTYIGDSRVQFSFLRGSLQMPQLKFILL